MNKLNGIPAKEDIRKNITVNFDYSKAEKKTSFLKSGDHIYIGEAADKIKEAMEKANPGLKIEIHNSLEPQTLTDQENDTIKKIIAGIGFE